jgi:hypothetical protein
LVGTWDSIGVGFNIQCVTYLVFAQLPISPYKLEQGEGRAVRPGMQAPVVVQYMVAEGTFDVRLRELLLPKADSSAYLTHSTDLSAMAATIADKSNQEKEASVMAGWLSWTEGVGDYE